MRRLLLLRHAKSDWDARLDTDSERPLNKRGVEAAKLMGRALQSLDAIPDIVLSSSAVRARETARLAARAGSWKCPIDIIDDLYDASIEDVVEVVRALKSAHDSALLIGHEPTFSGLAAFLVGGGGLKLPTAALARIDLDIDRWSQAGKGKGTLIWLITPGLLAAVKP